MYRGSIVALVTPFDDQNNIDIVTYRKLINWHLEQGTDGILVCGCTGESFTCSEDERDSLLSVAVEVVDGRIPVIMGTGASETKKAVDRTNKAKRLGANAALVITSFGNKPSQRGHIAYFETIAEVGLPIILYNVPSRTGTNLHPKTVVELSKNERIIAIKEASGNLDQVSAILLEAPGFTVLSGDDSLTLPMLLLGAKGVISTTANIVPMDFSEMIRSFENGNLVKAQKIHYKLYPIVKALFVEGNPVPLKAAMKIMGLLNGNLRPPLTEASKETVILLRKVLKDSGIIN